MGILNPTPEDFMQEALKEARKAAEEGEVPVGAVIVHDGHVIARGRNQRERLNDPTAHAEMIAITAAAESLGSWRLEDTACYVTLEPCLMCAGALLQARVPTLVYGATDPKAGACGTLYNLHEDPRLNHQMNLVSGVLAKECGEILSEFFRLRRVKHPESPE